MTWKEGLKDRLVIKQSKNAIILIDKMLRTGQLKPGQADDLKRQKAILEEGVKNYDKGLDSEPITDT